MPPRIKAAVPIALLLLIALVGALFAAAPAAAEHDSGNNLTLVYSSQSPDATGVTVTVYAEDHDIQGGGFQALDWIVVESEATSFAECGAGNARAIGIDRGSNTSGTRTDVALTSRVKAQNIGDSLMAQFYKEEDIGGDPTSLRNEDQVVARLANCFVNPSEPGWYQWSGDINGTNFEGEHVEYTMNSHYVYICECESRSAAVETLGPPPGQGSPDTPTATESTGGTDDTPTATDATGGNGGAPTATEATGGTDDTPTATDATGGNNVTPTATDTTSGQTTAGASDGDGSGGGADDDGQQTPAPADGPGFGGTVALLAFLAAALIAVRRSG